MKKIRIVVTAADPNETRVWGEVKALDEKGMPTIAHAEARLTYDPDVFEARSGDHVYQFRVDRPSKVTIDFKVDGTASDTPKQFDCTIVTAGRRYEFTVPK